LRLYSVRFDAVELNNTFYRRPTASSVDRWLAATPPDFRFAAKAQRSAAAGIATGSAADIDWLTEPYRRFGDRLGVILLGIPDPIARDDDRLAALLRSWPSDLPLAVELAHPSWHVDETFDRLTAHGAGLCVTDRPDVDHAPTIRRTGPLLYLRLRRHDYPAAEIDAWAARLTPFLDDGRDVYAFFRHDESGHATELAAMLAEAAARRLVHG